MLLSNVNLYIIFTNGKIMLLDTDFRGFLCNFLVRLPPVILESMNGVHVYKLNEPVTLKCTAFGHPDPEYVFAFFLIQKYHNVLILGFITNANRLKLCFN